MKTCWFCGARGEVRVPTPSYSRVSCAACMKTPISERVIRNDIGAYMIKIGWT